MQIVTIEENEIRMNTGMSESAFGKTKYDSIVTQQGLLAVCDSYVNGKYHFSFKPWTFNDVKALEMEGKEERNVFYTGSSQGFDENSKTLLAFYEDAGKPDATIQQKDEMFEASFALCCLLTQVALDGTEIPLNGGGGIVINLNKENTQILFMPGNLFQIASHAFSPVDASNLHGCWINSTVTGLPAICFERAVIVYKMLTGRFPYPAADDIERNSDILDRKFLPLELSVNGINPVLAKEVTKALKLNSTIVNIPGKKQKGKSSEDLTPTPDFPLDLLYSVKSDLKNANLSDEEFEKKAALYLKTQNSKITTKRTIRRNSTKIVVGAIAAVAITLITISTIKTRGEEITAKGLTSTQVIEGFYQGVNKKDSILLDNLTKGKKLRGYTNTVSQIYVVGKQRMTYNHDNGFASPENWILYITDELKNMKSGVYGVTNVKIDGKSTDLDIRLFQKNEKPEPVTVEKDIELKKGMKSVHNVEYFLLRSEGENNDVEVDIINETITLTYMKDYWLITDIETKSTSADVNSFMFKSEYFNAIRDNNGDVVKSVRQLQIRYPWLPSISSIQREKARLEEIAAHPFGF